MKSLVAWRCFDWEGNVSSAAAGSLRNCTSSLTSCKLLPCVPLWDHSMQDHTLIFFPFYFKHFPCAQKRDVLKDLSCNFPGNKLLCSLLTQCIYVRENVFMYAVCDFIHVHISLHAHMILYLPIIMFVCITATFSGDYIWLQNENL